MRINNLPQGAEYELFSQRTKTNRASFKGNLFDSIQSKDILDASLRLAQGGKVVTSKSSSLKNIDQMVADATQMVKYGSEHASPFASAANIAPMTLLDPKTLSSKEMIDFAGELTSKLMKLDKRLTVMTSLTHKINEISLKTSAGFDHSYTKSIWDLYAGITLVQGDDRFDVWEYASSMRPDFNAQSFVDDIARQLEWGTNVVDFKPGLYPVIFVPAEASHVLNPVIESLSGEAFYNKTSPWVDKLGKKMLDSRINLVDDGTIDNHFASKPFDGEGTPTQRNVLVEDGVIKTITLDNKYGARLNKPSTGNFDGLNYLQLPAGTKSFDDMIKSIDYGMIITSSMGAWSGNPFAGIVSGTVSGGLKVENGKVIGRVKDTMFTVNTFEHLNKHLIDLSSERKTIENDYDGSCATLPSIMLDKVVITSE